MTALPAHAHAQCALPPGPLTEPALAAHVWPLFSRVLHEGPREIYLANHSLGRPLDQTAIDVQEALNAWYARLDGAWEPWLREIERFRTNIAKLIGAPRSDCIIPKTAAGQGLRAVLNALNEAVPRVLATAGEFDSLDFILRTYHHRQRALVRWVQPRPAASPHETPTIDPADIIDAVSDYRPRLLLISHVYFTTGQVLDALPQIIAAARSHGGLVMLDAYHSAGVVPMNMQQLDVDCIVGGSYKYTRGGPGACWLALHPRLLPQGSMPEFEHKLRTLDTGWFAKKDTFKYERPDEPLLTPGGDAWLESTPAILPFYQARAGLELTLQLGVDRLRAYSLEQQARLAEHLDREGVHIVGPDADKRGAFLLLPHANAKMLCHNLLRNGVNADSRQGFVRFCPDILNSAADLARAAAIIARTLRDCP